MSAFLNNFVVSIISNNKPLRENSEDGMRTVVVPFDSEYKIRLKNKTKLRSKVKIFIDGMDIFADQSSLVLDVGQTIDLERFVEDLNSGKKFKFASLEKAIRENQVADPTSEDNGIIRVEFYQEKPYNWTNYVWTSNTINAGKKGSPDYTQITWTTNPATLQWPPQDKYPVTFTCGNSLEKNIQTSTEVCCSASTAGVTLAGGESNQSFAKAYDFETEEVASVIEIRLRGPKTEKKSEAPNIQQQNYLAFKKILPQLLADKLKHGKFVVVYDQKVTHMMDTFDSALQVALICYKQGEFNIQQILEI